MASFSRALRERSDIQQHLGLLHGLACQQDVGSIVEIGVRTGASTAALCASLKKVTSIDIAPCEPTATILRIEYPNWRFIQGDSRKVEPIACDMLFIDGEHTFETALSDLTRHGAAAGKWIVLHDTETFAEKGKDGSTPGLWEAINRFCYRSDPKWMKFLHLPNNNGLTILARR